MQHGELWASYACSNICHVQFFHHKGGLRPGHLPDSVSIPVMLPFGSSVEKIPSVEKPKGGSVVVVWGTSLEDSDVLYMISLGGCWRVILRICVAPPQRPWQWNGIGRKTHHQCAVKWWFEFGWFFGSRNKSYGNRKRGNHCGAKKVEDGENLWWF